MSTRGANLQASSKDCPCRGGSLAKLVHPVILMILAKGPLHGYGIVQEASRTPILAGERPDRTGVYRALRSLEQRGFVASWWELSESGPARKSYRLTAEGQECFARWIETLGNYHRALGRLVSDARKALGKSTSDRQG